MILKKFPPIFILLSIVVLSIACSKSDSPIMPSDDYSSGISQDLPESALSGNSNRTILAVYDVVIDPVKQTLTIEPDNRSAQYHYPLSLLISNVLQITDFGWTPNFWADIKLVHPHPGTGITGYDPRVIAIIPARDGVSMNYPTLDVHANNSVILEPDGYTKLFDEVTGAAGNANPFKAYFKDQPYRKWSGTGVTQETQRWQMNIAGFGGPIRFVLLVDVSTNYPNPPQPIIDNSPEPFQLDVVIGEGLTDHGGIADITATIFDWQGRITVGGVQIEAPDLIDGAIDLPFTGPGQHQYEFIYTGTITNEKLAPGGEYNYLVTAWDETTGINIYDEFKVVVSTLNMNGNLIWAKRAGGDNRNVGDAGGCAITSLSDNSTVIIGWFQNEIVFGLGEPNETTLIAFGDDDICIAKYNPDGLVEWAKNAGGSDSDFGTAITSLSDDSIVVTGYFYSTATFGLGEPNQTVLTAIGGSYDRDIFIARYNTDGMLLWAKRMGGTYSEECGYGITTLSDDSVVVTGGFWGSGVFGQGEPNETVLTSAGYNEVFVARYNSDGLLSWAKRAGGTARDESYAIDSLSDNSVVITGYFTETAVFGPDEPNETYLWAVEDEDIFIAQYNPDGSLAWARGVGGGGYFSDDCGRGVAALSDDSSIITGAFTYTATFGPDEPNETVLTSLGNRDIFIARYNSNGSLVWVKQAGGSHQNDAYAIDSLKDNSFVITGGFFDSTIFDLNGPDEIVLTSFGNWDVFIARYNSNGNLSWVKKAGGTGTDIGAGITSLLDDSSAVTGMFSGTAVFGPGEPNETYLVCSVYNNIFTARFEP